MNKLIQEVIEWGKSKNLIKKENSYKQFCKVVEEVAEVGTALNNKDEAELIDAIGDSTVTLILLAAQNNLDFEQCLQSAYNVIKDRTGKTEDGVFIKDQ
jgi:phosphoribosyl-ATP pyrophosphohydrolase